MILLDDNFATIVNAIEEGRAVYANIRKFSTYVLASNVPKSSHIWRYGLFGIPLALTIPQILAVDLGTDMVPALALGAEKPDAGMMSIPPRPRTERLMNLPLLLRAYVFVGLIEAGIAIGGFFSISCQRAGPGACRWTGHPLYKAGDRRNLRRHRRGPGGERFRLPLGAGVALRLGWFTNPLILWGIATELVVLAFIIYTPSGNAIFGTSPLPAWIFGPLALGALVLLFAEESRKIIVNRFTNSRAGRVTQQAGTS